MSGLTKVFFAQIDKQKLLKSQNYERGFWEFEEDSIELSAPISWAHGVFQLFSNNHDEFWSTLTGVFTRNKSENFNDIKNELIKINDDFNILSDVIELIALSGGDLFDIKDEFDLENTLIEEEDDSQLINLENYGLSNTLEEDNSVWVFEVLKYDKVPYSIENNGLILNYDSSEDLELSERFSFSVLIKK